MISTPWFGNRILRQLRPWAWIFVGSALGLSVTAHARVGAVLFEPDASAQNLLSNAGHTGVYFSNICADGPLQARVCKPGEAGSVLQRYPKVSKEKYDWLLTPAPIVFGGVNDLSDAPIVATKSMHDAVVKWSYDNFFHTAIAGKPGSTELPEGTWVGFPLATAKRNVYVFSIATTADDDQAMIDAINTDPNFSHFNIIWRNCANKVQEFLKIAMPGEHIHGSAADLGALSPLDLVKAIVDRGKRDLSLDLTVEKFSQLPSDYHRSRQMLYPLQNLYLNPTFAELAYFHTMAIITGGAALYHEVLHRFSYTRAAELFSAGEMHDVQARFLSGQQDLKSLQAEEPAARKNQDSSALNSIIEQEATDIALIRQQRDRLTQAHLEIWGTPAELQWYRNRFESTVRRLQAGESELPEEGRALLAEFLEAGSVHGAIISYIAKNAHFTVDATGITLQVQFKSESTDRSSPTSLKNISHGDPALATLLLITALDYSLAADSLDHVPMSKLKNLWSSFEVATASLGLAETANQN